jgi:prepilin-type N-terminal cleavage/methylation domain-containing protein
MKRRAFTLIELLVVIAIIAILAAILFPVFSQAKQAAKKTASISNTKQVILAQIMYQADYDDVFTPAVVWANGGAPASIGGVGYQPWTWLIMPYMKNGDIMQDPQAPPMEAWPSGWNTTTTKLLATQYGLNYTALSPYFGDPMFPNPVSSSGVANPANTVAIASKFSTAEDTLGATGFYWAGPGSWTTTVTVEAPHCWTIASWCFVNWGQGSWYETDYISSLNAGARTGGVSQRAGGQMVVTWVDGHSSTSAPGNLARGTNYTPTTPEADVVITNLEEYLWDIQ